MTPKTKAILLIGDLLGYIKEIDINLAKKLALITVNEIILSNPHSNPFNTDVYSTMDYWQEVKQEIEKLLNAETY